MESAALSRPDVPVDSEVLPHLVEVLQSQFTELRRQLAPQLCDAVRGAIHAALPEDASQRSRRPSVVGKSQDLVDFSRRSSEVEEPQNSKDTVDSQKILRPTKGFLSQKLLAELGQEDEPKRPGPLSMFGSEGNLIRATPLRALIARGSSKVSPAQTQSPQPPDVGPQEVEVNKHISYVSSEWEEPDIAPPLEPAPALGSSSMDNRSQNPMMSSLQSTSPSVAGGLGKGSRKASSMTEKAFGLHRTGSVTSLDLDRTYWIRVKLLALVQNVWFETLSMIMLITNAVIIGVQTDYMAVNKLPSTPWTLRAFDIWFCCFFSVEITLRILAHGRRFFSMNGCAWNMMDLGLVTAYVAETVLMIAAEDQAQGSYNGGNPEIMRVIRILRAIKVVRLVGAVRFAQDLQLLINCLFRSLKQFLWSALLLLLAIYVVAIYITQAATTYRLENANGEQLAVMSKWWGSIPTSVLSLFQGVTGGVDWHQIADPLIEGISPWFGLLFIGFMGFCILALLNVITGTFVETMSQQAKELQLRNRIFQARRLFKEIDIDGSGFISPDEILGQTSTPAVQEFFETIDVDPSDAKGLLEVIDIDGNGKINFEEFLEGSLRLNGSAKSSDLIMLAREMKRFQATQLKELAAIKAALE